MLRRALLPTLLIGLLATALVGCSDDEPTDPSNGTGEIAGTVTVVNGKAGNFGVLLDGGERQTSPNAVGGFSFEDVEVGLHTVTVQPPAGGACEVTEQEVGVTADETSEVAFQCTGGGGGGPGV